MRLTGTKRATSNTTVNPFGSLVVKPGRQTIGPGVGVNRTKLAGQKDQVGLFTSPDRGQGLRDNTTKKTSKLGNQALGETPPRDGPFAEASKPVATNFPTGTVLKSSVLERNRRQATEPRMANPFAALAAANRKAGYRV